MNIDHLAVKNRPPAQALTEEMVQVAMARVGDLEIRDSPKAPGQKEIVRYGEVRQEPGPYCGKRSYAAIAYPSEVQWNYRQEGKQIIYHPFFFPKGVSGMGVVARITPDLLRELGFEEKVVEIQG